jgi:hypothetical protein
VFNPLQAPRYKDAVKRLLGEELDLSSVTPELQLALILELDRPEWYILKNSRLWTTGVTHVAANAAGVGQVEVVNPDPNPPGTTTGLIVVVTSAKIINVPAAGRYVLNLNPGAAGAPVQNLVRDTRIRGFAAQSLNRILNTAVNANGVQLDEVTGVVGQDAVFDPRGPALPFVLGPFPPNFNRLAVMSVAVNTDLTVIMGGYEFVGMPAETATQ